MIVGRGQGIGFAVPVQPRAPGRRAAREEPDASNAHGSASASRTSRPSWRPELGVETGAGALVNSVSADGPGARARLRAGRYRRGDRRQARARRAGAHSRALRARRRTERLSRGGARRGRHYGPRPSSRRGRSPPSPPPRCSKRRSAAQGLGSPCAISAEGGGAARPRAAPHRSGHASGPRLPSRSRGPKARRCRRGSRRSERAHRRPNRASGAGRSHAPPRTPPHSNVLRAAAAKGAHDFELRGRGPGGRLGLSEQRRNPPSPRPARRPPSERVPQPAGGDPCLRSATSDQRCPPSRTEPSQR